MTLFILLLLIFFFPFLIFLFLLPLGYLLYALLNLLTVPLQILEIATNKPLRKNHALEHATINVIEEKWGRRGVLSGYARENGYYIIGPVDPETLEWASREAWERLARGEVELAVHSRCGTSIAVASFTTALIFILLLVFTHALNIFLVILAILLGQIFGPFLGEFTQKYFTTDPDVRNIRILGVEYDLSHLYGPFGITYPAKPSTFFIRTTYLREVRVFE
ncbi:MAG: hypothetical protein DRI28_01690 [Caldiserica bacterium]|mgnify:CR=1 FL=1|nr:MAG: hypothetical protein DRI28_01690 [Caldisericota bacterium]